MSKKEIRDRQTHKEIEKKRIKLKRKKERRKRKERKKERKERKKERRTTNMSDGWERFPKGALDQKKFSFRNRWIATEKKKKKISF